MWIIYNVNLHMLISPDFSRPKRFAQRQFGEIIIQAILLHVLKVTTIILKQVYIGLYMANWENQDLFL